MEDLCRMVQYSNGGLKTGLFMVQNVQYSNGQPSHMTLPIPDTPIVSYSGELGIQVSSIHMVTI